jgi:hypothetical protein
VLVHVHPAPPPLQIEPRSFRSARRALIGVSSQLNGASARIGSAANLRNSDRLLDCDGRILRARRPPSAIALFTAHGVTFISRSYASVT